MELVEGGAVEGEAVVVVEGAVGGAEGEAVEGGAVVEALATSASTRPSAAQRAQPVLSPTAAREGPLRG